MDEQIDAGYSSLPDVAAHSPVVDGIVQVPATALSGARWEALFLLLVGALSSTIVLKLASIQYLELLYLLQIVVLLAAFANRGFVVVWFRPFLRIGIAWAIFCAVALSLGVAALRLDFYIPGDLALLKHPVLITLSRVVELIGNVSAMVYLAHLFRKRPGKLRFTLRIYFWTGFGSAAFSLLSYVVNRAGFNLYGSYLSTHRLRGFYNEGGPYGLYVLSVLLAGFTLVRQNWENRGKVLWAFSPLAVAFVMAYSKAGDAALLLLAITNALSAKSILKRMATVALGGLVLVLLSQTINLPRVLLLLQSQTEGYERLSHRHIGDPNFIYGRVAGAFIAPRMAAAHPLAGVGWGNYGTLRNAPEFRGGAAWADESDDPGLGLWGYAPELGLPLFAFSFFCLFLPFYYLRRIKAPGYVQNLALLQPVVHLCGAQFNLTYPWIVTAFALGLGFSLRTTNTGLDEEVSNPHTSGLIVTALNPGL